MQAGRPGEAPALLTQPWEPGVQRGPASVSNRTLGLLTNVFVTCVRKGKRYPASNEDTVESDWPSSGVHGQVSPRPLAVATVPTASWPRSPRDGSHHPSSFRPATSDHGKGRWFPLPAPCTTGADRALLGWGPLGSRGRRGAAGWWGKRDAEKQRRCSLGTSGFHQLPFTCCVTLGKSLHVSEPPFMHR